MKRAREVLMGQHAGVEGRLDTVRLRVVQAEVTGGESLWWRMWCELVLPSRRVWAGLGLVWVVVLGLHLGAGVEAERLGQGGVTAMGEVEQAVLVEQVGMRWELLGMEVERGGRIEAMGPRSDAGSSGGMRLATIRMRERGEV